MDQSSRSRTQAQGGTEEELPFDPMTLLRGVWRRRRIVLVAAVVSVVIGVAAGYRLGTRVYEARTVLVGVASRDGDHVSRLDLTTEMNLVKVHSNIGAVRDRVGLSVPVSTLGRAIRVTRQGDTALLIVAARWDDAEGAAAIANTMRDVYLERRRERVMAELADRVAALEERIVETRTDLAGADSALQAYATENRIVDLDKEAQWFLEELTAIDLLYEEARSEEVSNRLQRESIDSIIGVLQEKVMDEFDAGALEGIGTLNLRVERLRDAIRDDEERRAMDAELAQRELELQQARRLREAEVISEVEFRRIQNAYDRQLAYSRDTEQTAQWRAQLEELQNRVLPATGGSPSATLLRDVLLRSFDLDLASVTLEEKVAHLAAALAKVQARLDLIPLLERNYMALLREVTVGEKLLQKLRADLVDARTQLQSGGSRFRVVTTASVPVFPLESNRRLVFLGAVAFGLVAGMALVVGLELSDQTVKSEAEARKRLHRPLLGSLPRFRSDVSLTPDGDAPILSDRGRRIAHRLRAALPEGASRILVVSTQPGEGTTTIASNLAASLGGLDERVLLIDAHLRHETEASEVQLADAVESLRAETGVVVALVARLAGRVWAVVGPRIVRGGRALIGHRGRLANRVLVGIRRRVGAGTARYRRVRRSWLAWQRLQRRREALTRSVSEPEAELGLGSFLTGDALESRDVESSTSWAGVTRIASSRTDVPSTLLGSKRMGALISDASTRFTSVVIDAPPLSRSADALTLIRWVDAVVLVVRSQGPKVSTVCAAIDEIEALGVPVVGLVLNAIDPAYCPEAA